MKAARSRRADAVIRRTGSIALALTAMLDAHPVRADSFFPTTFLDISGTYAHRLFDAHCASFRPPPNILTLELESEEDTEDGLGKRLTYTGSFDYYESPVIRPDCATMDREIACGFQPLVDGRCGLGGNRLTVSGVFEWRVTDGVFGPQVGWGISQPFRAVREPGVEGPLPGGVQGPYFNADELRIDMMNSYGFGPRADLGEVTRLGASISVVEASAGPDSICTCQARSPDDRVFCCPGAGYFEKVSGNAQQLDVFADITGTLKSSLPTLTATDKEVHRARIRLLRQNEGSIRAQMAMETDQAYEAYLTTKTFTPATELTIERSSAGVDTFGSPGKFVVENVRVFQPAERGGRRVWEPARYTIEIRAAQTDEFVIDPGTMQPIPGKTAPLYFAPKDIRNVVPGATSIGDVELVPFTALETKQAIVDRLTERCAVNYGPIEQGAAAYLEQIRNGTLEITPTREEGLKRAIWAERAINGSAALAKELFDLSLTGLGTLVADVFADLTDFSSAKLSAAKKRLDKINSTPPASIPAGFNADKLAAAQKKAAADANRIVDDADVAESLKATVKALKPLIEAALIKAGVSPDTAASISGNYTLVMATIFSAIQTGTLRGGAVPLIKKAIEDAVKLATPILMDSTDAVAFSYCQTTKPPLMFSVDRMQSWNTSDDNAFRIHRENAVTTITRMNDEASDAIAAVGALIEVAQGLDTVQDAASVIGKAVKWVKIVEGVAGVMKYGFNANAAVTPIIVVYSSVNDFAEQAAYQSFGQLPPAMRIEAEDSGRSALYRASANVEVSDAQPMLTALAAVRAALEADDVGTAVELVVDEGDASYQAERDTWTDSVSAFLAQAAAVDPAAADLELTETLAQSIIGQVELYRLEAELDEVLTELFEQVLTGEYATTSDPLYVARRNRVLTYIDVVTDEVAMLGQTLDLLDFELASGLSFAPTVVVESVVVESQTTGDSAIAAAGEVFDLRARVRNLSDVPVVDVGAVLTLGSPEGSVTALDALDAVIAGGLAADDGVAGSGPDQAEVLWRVRYDGSFAAEVIVLDVEASEVGAPPTSFFSIGSQVLLPLDPSVGDADLDSLPDGYEADKGLDLGSDDASSDPDADGLDNRAEFEIGTEPLTNDSDADGIGDGDELFGAGGFVTDPLDPDSDDDGTLDGEDGAPLDGDSTMAPPPADEPAVSLSATEVTIDSGDRLAFVTVTNAGTGTLEWTAEADEPALVQVSPRSPERRREGAMLGIAVPSSFDFTTFGAFETTVTVSDVSGLLRDSVAITVRVVGDAAGGFCGAPTAESAEDAITATDALFALNAAVGLQSCESCVCDVDDSGTVSASDALVILNAAVGIEVPLVCPAC